MSAKKRVLVVTIAMLAFLLALLVTLYPLISTWYNDHHQAQIHVQYKEELNQKDDAIGRLANTKNQLESQIVGEALIRRDYEARIGQMESDYKTLQISYEELKATKKQEAAAEVHALRQTILELKAKLYDMMTGEEVK